MRLFVAAKAAEVGRAVLQELPPGALEGFRVTPSERMHLTLLFLGEVSAREVASLERDFDRLDCGPPFVLLFDHLIGLPHNQHGRVVATAARQEEAFDALVRRLQEQLAAYLRRPSAQQAPLAHITLARRRVAAPVKAVAHGVKPLWVRDIYLMESRLYPEGPQYGVRLHKDLQSDG